MTPTTQPTIIDHETGEIVPAQKNRAYYVNRIKDNYATVISLGIDIGNHLIDAKKTLPHGEFEAMIESDLPFGVRTARMLMTNAEHPVISNRKYTSDLPQSWYTCYQLSHQTPQDLIAKIESGEVNPNTTQKEAIAMRGGRNLDALMTSQSEEWYTTPDIINLAIEALGDIDLDPCSNSHESPNVPAAHHFTKEDDGLSQEWFGKVYMNPPYGSAIPHWIEKVITEYKSGRVEQAIVLVPARTDTRWFRMLKEYPRCFMWGRVRFNDHANSAPFPTMLVALGVDIEQFVFVTKDTGDVYTSL